MMLQGLWGRVPAQRVAPTRWGQLYGAATSRGEHQGHALAQRVAPTRWGQLYGDNYFFDDPAAHAPSLMQRPPRGGLMQIKEAPSWR